jgi:hypothetical protein
MRLIKFGPKRKVLAISRKRTAQKEISQIGLL